MEQLTFTSFSPLPIPTTVIKLVTGASQPIKQKTNRHQGVTEKILEKRERILGLQKQIEDNEEEILNPEQEEEEYNPEKGEKDIFDVVVPAIESDIYGLRVENEIEIKLLEDEIVELEKKRR